jgi:UDP-N-acetylglucosamine acyltransferase
MQTSIHPSAIVDAQAEIARGVEIGPYCVIGPGVRIDEGTRLAAHVVVYGPTAIGKRNVIHSFAVIGDAPQHKRHQGGPTRLTIGDANVIREHVTIHRGTRGDGAARAGDRASTGTETGTTTIGSSNLFMVGCHVAHDVTVGSHATIANGVQLAGHAVVGDYATFGGLSGLAQHVRVGESAFVAAGAMCERDVPPFVIVQGDRARVRALNKVGLRRRGVPEASIAALEDAFRALWKSGRTRADALAEIAREDAYVAKLLDAL